MPKQEIAAQAYPKIGDVRESGCMLLEEILVTLTQAKLFTGMSPLVYRPVKSVPFSMCLPNPLAIQKLNATHQISGLC